MRPKPSKPSKPVRRSIFEEPTIGLYLFLIMLLFLSPLIGYLIQIVLRTILFWE